jgi:hypothetical protein
LITYQPPTTSRKSTASAAAIAGTRDGSRVAAGALSVRGDAGTADDERNGKSSSDGGVAGRGAAAALGGLAFGGAAAAGAAGRGGGADEADGRGIEEAEGRGIDEAGGGGAAEGDCVGTDAADGGGANKAVGAGEDVTGGVSFNAIPRAAQNCSRFSRLVVTNGSSAGKLDVAMA